MPSESTARCILWVDDHPENNVRERNALVGLGFSVSVVHSTRQALSQLSARVFAAIISDMGRWEGQQEGHVLLEAIRSRGLETPFFFYAGSSDAQHVADAKRRGAQGCTNEMQRLLEMVRASAAPEA